MAGRPGGCDEFSLSCSGSQLALIGRSVESFTLNSATFLGTFLLATVVALIGTRAVRDLAVRRGWVARPSLSRHMHRNPVPRVGGVAIYVSSWLTAAVVLAVLSVTDPNASRTSARTLLAIFTPATLIFGVGLVDDFRNLRARTKLGAQIVAAALLYFSGLGVTHLGSIFGKSTLAPIIGLPLTVAWVVAITNAFNLIDGLDGLAAGSAFVSTSIVFVVSVLQDAPLIAILAAALAGSILGFLRYNFNPASIFLGDSGSLYIGFMLSAAALAGSQKSSTIVAVAIPVVSFGLPILDVSVAIVRRFLGGRPLFEADAEHIHHKLLKRGLSHRDAVLILYGVSALFGLLSITLYPKGHLLIPMLAVIGSGVFFGVQQLRYHEFTELQRVARRILNQMRVIANNIAIRRAAEALQSCQSLGDIGGVLIEYLEPIGFDGFALEVESLGEVPESSLLPFHRPSSHPTGPSVESSIGHSMPKTSAVISLGRSEPDVFALRLEFCLSSGAGGRKRSFSVFRACCKDPLWFDSNVFVSSGFVAALDEALLRTLERKYLLSSLDSYLEKTTIEVEPSLAAQ
jgi:UDP-GlcNAc:undecaprenyl-phosphate/decaprenyl-phosphate GlcNAc-1-phosphate transferase